METGDVARVFEGWALNLRNAYFEMKNADRTVGIKAGMRINHFINHNTHYNVSGPKLERKKFQPG